MQFPIPSFRCATLLLELPHFKDIVRAWHFFLMLFFLSPVYGILIASFSAKTPPPKICQPYQVDIASASTNVWIAPTRKELCSIACCDNNVIHYFLYSDDKLVRIVWEEEEYIDVFYKALMLRKIRGWYEVNGNQTLRIVRRMSDIDTLAWSLSHVLDDI